MAREQKNAGDNCWKYYLPQKEKSKFTQPSANPDWKWETVCWVGTVFILTQHELHLVSKNL